jgi:hypothetical protein
MHTLHSLALQPLLHHQGIFGHCAAPLAVLNCAWLVMAVLNHHVAMMQQLVVAPVERLVR